MYSSSYRNTGRPLDTLCIACAFLTGLNIPAASLNLTHAQRIHTDREALALVGARVVLLVAVPHTKGLSVALIHTGQFDVALVLIGT